MGGRCREDVLIRESSKFFLNILQTRNLLFRLFQVESPGVIGVELVDEDALGVPFLEELVVVEVAVVGRHPVEVAHVNGLGCFFLGQEGLVHLLAMTDTDDFDVFLLAAEQLANGLGLGLDGAGGGLLDQDVTVTAVLEGKEDKVDGFVERHDEPCHGGFRERDRAAITDLLDPERDYGTTGAHDIAISGAANLGIT